jgi:hypothetical protein
LRQAEARGLDLDAALPQLVVGRSFDGAGDVASALRERVDRWTRAAGGRRRSSDNFVAGLIPRVRNVADPDMARALSERDQAMEERARTLAIQGIESRQTWVNALGAMPHDPGRRARWMYEVSTVAAYRDRWHIIGDGGIGSPRDAASSEQTSQRRLAEGAAKRALGLSREAQGKQANANWDPRIDVVPGVEL